MDRFKRWTQKICFQLTFYIRHDSSLILRIHSKGTHFSELPYSASDIQNLPITLHGAKIDLTLSTALKYGKKECEPDLDYNQDECREEFMHKVSRNSKTRRL